MWQRRYISRGSPHPDFAKGVTAYAHPPSNWTTNTGNADGGFSSPASPPEGRSSGDVDAQRYDANGVAMGGEAQVNIHTPNARDLPPVTGPADGGFVVAWQLANQDGSGYGIYAQRYDASSGGEDVHGKPLLQRLEPPGSGDHRDLQNGAQVCVRTALTLELALHLARVHSRLTLPRVLTPRSSQLPILRARQKANEK